jgi:hypothetical protein
MSRPPDLTRTEERIGKNTTDIYAKGEGAGIKYTEVHVTEEAASNSDSLAGFANSTQQEQESEMREEGYTDTPQYTTTPGPQIQGLGTLVLDAHYDPGGNADRMLRTVVFIKPSSSGVQLSARAFRVTLVANPDVFNDRSQTFSQILASIQLTNPN